MQQEYPSLDRLYKELHAAPELSQQERKTAARVAEELRKAGFEVTGGVGGHGVVGVLRNGNGPTVLVRADVAAKGRGLLGPLALVSNPVGGKGGRCGRRARCCLRGRAERLQFLAFRACGIAGAVILSDFLVELGDLIGIAAIDRCAAGRERVMERIEFGVKLIDPRLLCGDAGG